MVVDVLITSCQVSENPNNGPLTAHSKTRTQQVTNANGRPVNREMSVANWVKRWVTLPLMPRTPAALRGAG